MIKYFRYLQNDQGKSIFAYAPIFYEGKNFVAHSTRKDCMSLNVNITHKHTSILICHLVDKESAIELVDEFDRVLNNQGYKDHSDYYKSWYQQALQLKKILLPVVVKRFKNTFLAFSQSVSDRYEK